jgi:hypothetical protein
VTTPRLEQPGRFGGFSSGYCIGVAQDITPSPSGAAGDAPPYSDHEKHALSLAAELRTRVERERATVAKLRAYLTRREPPR